VIKHKLYWGTVSNRDEGHFLCAVINCPELTQVVRPLMSYGKDEHHIDKQVWKLPVPTYDLANETHGGYRNWEGRKRRRWPRSTSTTTATSSRHHALPVRPPKACHP